MAHTFRRSRRARVLAVTAVLFGVVLGGALAAWNAYGALRDSRDELAAADAERRATRRHLAATRVDVEAEEYARDLLRAQLHEVERQIRLARGDLNTTRRRSAARFTRIPILTECLNGVASALNAASVGDERATVLAVLAIEPTCARAEGRSR